MPKPGIPRLTKQNMEDAPEEKWVSSVQNVVNNIADNVDNILVSNKSIKLLRNTDLELHEFPVQVPDPWITGTLVNDYTGTLKYMKHPNGDVETRFDVITGAGGTIPFIFPVGYRPAETIYGFAYNYTTPDWSFASVGTNGNVTFRTDNNHRGTFLFLSSDATPVPLSCWPINIETKLDNVVGVLVCDVRDDETSSPLPEAIGAPVWETTTINGVKNVRLLNIIGLPYNRKYRIKLLFFGG